MTTVRQNSTESTAALSAQQTEVLRAIVEGSTVVDAARRVGIHRSTYYVWLKSNPTFVAELNREKKERADAVRAQLQALGDPALSALRKMLTGKGIPAAVQRRNNEHIAGKTIVPCRNC